MGLFGTIQQSAGALNVAQVGIQVVGNNIANANTDGYIRSRLEQAPAASFRTGSLVLGQGVRATGVKQIIDQALAERMFNAQTAVAGGEALSAAYNQLEQIASDLDGGGLNEQFSLFNNALHDLSTRPNDNATREFVLQQGDSLARSLQSARSQADGLRDSWNAELSGSATQVNRLTKRIAELNTQIATVEGGGLLGSDATGLRDQRYRDLEELASYVDINFQEQASGTVSIFVGGDYLVADGHSREVYSAINASTGGQEVRIRDTDAPLNAKGGKLGAAIEIRNGIFGDYVQQLDSIAAALIKNVNEIHSQGQGRRGFDAVVGASPSDPGVPLRTAGLPFEPKNGTFDVNVVDSDGKLVSTHRIRVRNLGEVGDDTVGSVVSQLDAIPGLSASLSGDGRIRIDSDATTTRFTFGEDTSGFLAAAGINTFFTGTDASDIAVNAKLKSNVDLLAISKGGLAKDTDTLFQMLDLVDRPLDSLNGLSIRGLHEQTLSSLGREISLQNSATQGVSDYYATLKSQHLAITGVNIDEESIKLLAYQRAFQASARVISTASEMLEILVNL